jgi:hypothetical protein
MTYLFNILIALSQLGNTILGGYPDESMSARAWRTGSAGKWPGVATRPLIDVLFFVVTFGRDRQHCQDAYDSERLRRQFPEHYRG